MLYQILDGMRKLFLVMKMISNRRVLKFFSIYVSLKLNNKPIFTEILPFLIINI